VRDFAGQTRTAGSSDNEKDGRMDAHVMTERRRSRRVDLPDVPVVIRPVNADDLPGQPVECQLRNVSLTGLSCLVPASVSLQPNDRVVCSVLIPRERTRTFPFTRLHGRGWVLRVEPTAPTRRAGDTTGGQTMLGMAIAFAPDASALATFE
jgi:hypothetical protein